MKDHFDNISADAPGFIAATPAISEKKIMETGNLLTAASTTGKNACETIQNQALAGAKATDKAIRANPYRAIGIALGVGAIFGIFLLRRSNRPSPVSGNRRYLN